MKLLFFISILFCYASVNISVAEQTKIFKPQSAEKIAADVWLETATNTMLDEIDLNYSKFRQDDAALQMFLYNTAIPFWDIKLMAKSLGGKPYRRSSEALKVKLEEQWKRTLLRYFLKGMSFYDGQRLVLNKEKKCPSVNRCKLRTSITIAGRKAVNLDFYVRWNKQVTSKHKWQLIDLRVAGISLLKHKRGETREILKKEGLKGLIAALKRKNDKILLASIVWHD